MTLAKAEVAKTHFFSGKEKQTLFFQLCHAGPVGFRAEAKGEEEKDKGRSRQNRTQREREREML